MILKWNTNQIMQMLHTHFQINFKKTNWKIVSIKMKTSKIQVVLLNSLSVSDLAVPNKIKILLLKTNKNDYKNYINNYFHFYSLFFFLSIITLKSAPTIRTEPTTLKIDIDAPLNISKMYPYKIYVYPNIDISVKSPFIYALFKKIYCKYATTPTKNRSNHSNEFGIFHINVGSATQVRAEIIIDEIAKYCGMTN